MTKQVNTAEKEKREYKFTGLQKIGNLSEKTLGGQTAPNENDAQIPSS